MDILIQLSQWGQSLPLALSERDRPPELDVNLIKVPDTTPNKSASIEKKDTPLEEGTKATGDDSREGHGIFIKPAQWGLLQLSSWMGYTGDIQEKMK